MERFSRDTISLTTAELNELIANKALDPTVEYWVDKQRFMNAVNRGEVVDITGSSLSLGELLAPLGAHYIGGFAFRGVAGAGLIRAFDTSLATAYPMASALDAELHATPGYVSILAGANKGLVIPKLEMDLSSYPGRNLILAWGMKKALPSIEEPILGTSASSTGAAPGLNFSTLASGKLKITGQTTQGSSISLASSLLPVADAAGNPHVVMVADHAYINRLQVLVDAQFSNNVTYGAAGVRRDISQVSNLVLGGIGGTDQFVYANQFSALHALWVPDRFTRYKQVAELLTANISMPLQGAVL